MRPRKTYPSLQSKRNRRQMGLCTIVSLFMCPTEPVQVPGNQADAWLRCRASAGAAALFWVVDVPSENGYVFYSYFAKRSNEAPKSRLFTSIEFFLQSLWAQIVFLVTASCCCHWETWYPDQGAPCPWSQEAWVVQNTGRALMRSAFT